MKGAILGNRWLRAAIVLTAVVVGWGLLVYAADWPLVQRNHYACPICRAGKTVTSYLMIPIRVETNDNEFSRYYRSHADSQHRHTWLGCGVSRRTRTGGISAHGAPVPLQLIYEAALAIVKSLPDRKTRKAFFEQLCVADESTPEGRAAASKNAEAICKLNDAYWENEHRRDWPSQLRKVGLYPEP